MRSLSQVSRSSLLSRGAENYIHPTPTYNTAVIFHTAKQMSFRINKADRSLLRSQYAIAHPLSKFLAARAREFTTTIDTESDLRVYNLCCPPNVHIYCNYRKSGWVTEWSSRLARCHAGRLWLEGWASHGTFQAILNGPDIDTGLIAFISDGIKDAIERPVLVGRNLTHVPHNVDSPLPSLSGSTAPSRAPHNLWEEQKGWLSWLLPTGQHRSACTLRIQ